VDLYTIGTIIGYLTYAAWIFVIVGIIISAVLFALGKLKEGSKKFTMILTAAFVLTFAFTILNNAIPYQTYNLPGWYYISYLAYAGAAVSVIATAIYLVKGDLRVAGTYFVAAVLILWAVNYAPALFSTQQMTSSTFGTIMLSASPESGNAPLTFTLQGYVIPAPNQTEDIYVYAINESTGQTFGMAGGTVGTNGQFCITESIGAPGQYEIIAYIPGTSIQGSTAVDITPAPNFGWNFVAAGFYAVEQFFEGLASNVLHIFNLPFIYAIMMPTYPTNGGDPFGIGQTIYQMYQYTEGIAFGILGIFLIGNILYRLWNGVEEGISRIIIGVSKDVITVAFVIVTAPYLYDVFADIVNMVGGHLINYGNPGALLAEAFGVIAAGMGLGYFVPELANIGSDLVFAIFLAFALFVIRFLAIAAILIATPILAAMWLFPPFRGAVRLFFDIILALGISGIIAASLLALLGKLASASPILSVGIGLASPVLFGFLPTTLSFIGVSGIMTQGGFFPFGRGKRGTSPQSSAGSAGGVAGGVAGATITQTAGQTKLRNPRAGSTTSTSTVSSTVSSPPPAPVGIAERLRNRKTVTVTSNPRDNLKFPEKLRGGLKKETDYIGPVDPEKLKQYGKEMEWVASSAPPIPGIHEHIKKYGENRAREMGISPEQRGRVVRYRETIPHALARGVAENLKAGAIMTAQKFGQKMDDWLNQQGISVRPFESIENKIREVKLRKSKTNRPSSQ